MDKTLERPFYFIIVLWGERFREYFLEYCVPSLLASQNLPALSTRTPSKLLIATRPEDWAAIQATPIFRVLSRYVLPVYIEIPPCPPGRTGYQHMGLGHRIACDMAHRDKVYATVLTPDCMLSDGSVARLQELAQSGTQLVLTAALRFGEEPFLKHLRDMGALTSGSRSESGTPIAVTGRQMVFAAVNGFHSETLAYEWDAPGLMAISPAAWWRVPDENGILLHSLSWAPLLLDYSAIADHDISTFEQWTLDGDYLFNNTSKIEKIHIVQDSDELFLASWGPLNERPVTKTRFPFDKFLASHFFKQSFYSGFFDPLKRKLFFLPVRWHSRALNDKWAIVEKHAMLELRRLVKPPSEGGATVAERNPGRLRPMMTAIRNVPLSILRAFIYIWIFRHRIGPFMRRTLRGDRAAIARIAWFARSFVLGKGYRSQPLNK
jgi:hypothetical protein